MSQQRTVCHLTTTHPADDARIQRERRTVEQNGNYTTVVKNIVAGYPKWQHPFRLLALAKQAMTTNASIFHCHEPDALGIALLRKSVMRNRVIYDVHEHWPSELPRDVGAPHWLSHLIDPVEQWMARRADAVITVSESVGQRFPGSIVLPNYPNPPTTPLPNVDISLRSLAIVGAKLHPYHIRDGLSAVTRLRTCWPDVTLNLIGNLATPVPEGSPVTCTGYLPHAAIPAALQQAGIGLALLSPDYENIRIGLPNRLFSYMMAGIPVIATALPEIERIVDETNCGILVQPDDVDAIVDAAIWLEKRPIQARWMGERGRQAIVSRYNWDAVQDRLITCLTDSCEW